MARCGDHDLAVRAGAIHEDVAVANGEAVGVGGDEAQIRPSL